MSSLQPSSRFIPFTNSAQRTQHLPGQGNKKSKLYLSFYFLGINLCQRYAF